MILLLKLVLVPLLIWSITLAGRRWGPRISGWLSAFPILSAPILFIVALEHGAAFTAHAAVGTLSAVLANVVFGLGYAWGATRYSWAPSLLVAFCGYFLALACLTFWSPSLFAAIFAVLIALLVAPRLYPVVALPTESGPRPVSDVFWRIGAGVLLVLLVTHFAAALGPRLSGALAMFPMMAPVLAVFSHRQSGAGFTVHLLRGMVLGYYAFSVFCVVLALALAETSIGLAFLLALGSAALVQGVSHLHLRRSRQASPSPASP